MAKIVVSQFFGSQEQNQVVCASAEEARRVIDQGNADAATRWRWGLSPTNFTDDNGVPLSIEAANEIRRACGETEY